LRRLDSHARSAGAIHGAIKGKSATDVATAARGGKAAVPRQHHFADAVRPRAGPAGNPAETLPDELAPLGPQSLRFFNDYGPNFVSNARLKIIHLFEGPLWLTLTAYQAFGAFHAARFFQDPTAAVAGLPRHRRRLSARPILYARARPEMARQVRQPGCESECDWRVKRAAQSRPRAPRLKLDFAPILPDWHKRQVRFIVRPHNSRSSDRESSRLSAPASRPRITRRFYPLVFDEPL